MNKKKITIFKTISSCFWNLGRKVWFPFTLPFLRSALFAGDSAMHTRLWISGMELCVFFTFVLIPITTSLRGLTTGSTTQQRDTAYVGNYYTHIHPLVFCSVRSLIIMCPTPSAVLWVLWNWRKTRWRRCVTLCLVCLFYYYLFLFYFLPLSVPPLLFDHFIGQPLMSCDKKSQGNFRESWFQRSVKRVNYDTKNVILKIVIFNTRQSIRCETVIKIFSFKKKIA